jgi:Ankyrin repeats (3 copies)
VKLLLERKGIEINSKDKKGRTPLSYAVEEGHEEVVKLLLRRNHIEIMTKDEDAETSLSGAIKHRRCKIAELLRQKPWERGDIDELLGSTPDDGLTGYMFTIYDVCVLEEPKKEPKRWRW